ncbi:MAG TPA: hypothetical protein PKH65_03580 [Bacteroidia bacterium]|nr:hypothetical protein [Bacteroidia bacterium]HNT79740.1 hypothetical protein [Bacteroidia bacterium]
MEKLNDWTNVLFFIAPLLVLAGGFYLMVKKMFDRDSQTRLMELKIKNRRDVLALRLQAYERMILFLERISPNNLLIRSSSPGLSAGEFQSILLQNIRTEYEHNVTQQIYMSIPAWASVRAAREGVIKLINTSMNELDPNAPSIELSKKIFDTIIKMESQGVQMSIDFIKEEARQLY